MPITTRTLRHTPAFPHLLSAPLLHTAMSSARVRYSNFFNQTSQVKVKKFSIIMNCSRTKELRASARAEQQGTHLEDGIEDELAEGPRQFLSIRAGSRFAELASRRIKVSAEKISQQIPMFSSGVKAWWFFTLVSSGVEKKHKD